MSLSLVVASGLGFAEEIVVPRFPPYLDKGEQETDRYHSQKNKCAMLPDHL